MSASPAPASLHLPPPRAKKLPGSPKAARDTVEAPGPTVTVTMLFGARIEVRGCMGVSTDAVAQYVAMLQEGIEQQARLARLNAPTLPAPACIEDALEGVVEDEPHPADCTDPCCTMVYDDDDLDDDAYCADEGHQVLTSGAAYYGVGAW